MSHGFQRIVDHLRKMIGRSGLGDSTDRELLARFAATSDGDAFTAIVTRHAGLVFGVCRRVLGNDADAEDAFQVTFVLLARQAGRGGWHDSVAGREGRLERVEADRAFDAKFSVIVDFAQVYELRKPGSYTIEWGSGKVARSTVTIEVVDGLTKAAADGKPRD
jgi:hypothetical protein